MNPFMPSTPAVGTLKAYDAVCDIAIDEARPAWANASTIKRELAVFWLRSELPGGFWSRFVWSWRLVRQLCRWGKA